MKQIVGEDSSRWVNSVDLPVHPASLLFCRSPSPNRVTTKSPDSSPPIMFYSRALYNF